MAGTLVKSVKLKITADDGDTEAKLRSISAKADELGRKHPELKVKIDAAGATAKLAVLRKELKDTGSQADQSGHSLRNAFLGLTGGADAMKLFSADTSMAGKALAGLSLATGLLEPLAAGAIVGVGGLGAAAVASGAGLGIFGAVAKGVYSKVSTALTAYTAAQAAASKATTAAGRASALKAEQAATEGLTGSQKHLLAGITGVKAEWGKFVNDASPGVVGVISRGMGLIPKALSLMKPFLAPVESALRGIVANVSHGLDSSGFKSFMNMLSGHAGGDITKLGGIIGHIAVGLGGIVKAFTPVSGVILGGIDKMTAGFAKWGQTLSGHSGFQSLMSEAKQYAPAIATSLKNIGSAAVHLVGDMAGTKSMVPVWAAILPPLTSFLNKLIKANPMLVQFGLYALAAGASISKVGKGFTSISNGLTSVKSMGSAISGLAVKLGLAKAATEGETVAAGEMDGAMDANPIGLIVIAIAGLVIGIVELWKHSTGFRNFFKGMWKDIKSWVGDAVTFIKGHWKLIFGILTGPIGLAVVFISSHWKQIVNGAKNMVSNVIGFFRSLPGKILNVLSSLPGQMLSFGGHIISMLAHGILGGLGDVVGAIGHVASAIWDHIPHSPARKGPLSGQGSPDVSGRKTSLMFAQGILAGAPAVQAASARIARSAGLAGSARGGQYAAAGAGGGGWVEAKWVGGQGDQEFMTWVKKNVRLRGGDPGVLGR